MTSRKLASRMLSIHKGALTFLLMGSLWSFVAPFLHSLIYPLNSYPALGWAWGGGSKPGIVSRWRARCQAQGLGKSDKCELESNVAT